MQQKWFRSWFNSPYYHILYSGRNEQEAGYFIDNLLHFLHPPAHARILDIACGKGRHSIYLRKKDFDVTGIDLSVNSIKYAQQFEDAQLHFFVHDMRKLLYINYFDIALNLFTSFGYFETAAAHLNALKSFRKGLRKNGVLVLDYFNATKVIQNLVPEEIKELEGIAFKINKKVFEGKILKEIRFWDGDNPYAFTEQVQAFTREDFNVLMKQAGLRIKHEFGSYALVPFDINKSDRLIMICEKI